jgi:hypothetical protein
MTRTPFEVADVIHMVKKAKSFKSFFESLTWEQIKVLRAIVAGAPLPWAGIAIDAVNAVTPSPSPITHVETGTAQSVRQTRVTSGYETGDKNYSRSSTIT